MTKRLMWVEYEDGAELSNSRTKPGAKSALTRSPRGDLSHATLTDLEECDYDDYDDDDAEESTEFESEGPSLAPAVIVGGVVVVGALVAGAVARARWAREHQDRRSTSNRAVGVDWGALVVRAAKFAWPHLVRAAARALALLRLVLKLAARVVVSAVRRGGSLLAQLIRTATARWRSRKQQQAASSQRDHVLPSTHWEAMSADEAYQRLCLALITRAISDQQFRKLLSARIADVRESSERSDLQRTPHPEELSQQLEALAAGRPDLLWELDGLVRRDHDDHTDPVLWAGGS